MPKGRKNAKAKLRKNRAKKKSAQQQNKKKKENSKNKDNNNIINKKNEVLDLFNPDENLKEFNRDITLHKFSLQPIGGGDPLIRNSNVKLTHGHIYGLIGHNGSGKTTFLKKISSGIKEIPKYLRVIHTHQELPPSNMTVIETILRSDKERTLLINEEKRLRKTIDELTKNIDGDGDDKKNSKEKDNTKENAVGDKVAANVNGNANADANKVQDNDKPSDKPDDIDKTDAKANDNDKPKQEPKDTQEDEPKVNEDAPKVNEDARESHEDSNKDKKKREKELNKQKHDNMMIDKLINDLNLVHDRLKFIEADTAEARASDVLEGLCFTDRMKNMKTSDLSGGWRMRVALACSLFVEPDLLLLDEPTNHLDFPSVIWLSDYLTQCYPKDKTIVVVSHDRRFLNDLCTDIIHLNRCRLSFYKGNYDSFIRIRNEMRKHQKKQYDRQQATIKHNTEFIARFKANKKWSTQAQSRQKLLNKVTKIEKVLNDLEFRFDFPNPPPLKNNNILHLDDVTFGYFGEDETSNSYLLKNIDIRVEFGTKIGILGANGSGKTTLLQLILNNLKPLMGSCVLQNEVEVGYFTQHHVDQLDYNATPLQHLKNVFKDATMQQIYGQLGRFKLGQNFAKRQIGTLSGGQKSRIAFAILTWYSPHLIIMDEPTNHLDMPTIDALTAALCDFPGSVIVVSHDQYFVETICDEYWAVGNRSVKMFDDFEQCRKFSQTLKPVDVLPRQFSSVQVKKKIYDEVEHKGDENDNNNKNNGDNSTKKKRPKKQKDKDAFGIDPERKIDQGLDKGLTPDQILRHVNGWKPIDGNPVVTNKLGFILFHDYFDSNYENMDENEFFCLWKNLLKYCIPINFIKNQIVLIDIAYACYNTANKDNKKRATDNFGFGTIIKHLYILEIITLDAIKQFLEQKRKKYKREFIKQIDTYIEILENPDDDSDSDDDSD